MASKTPAGSRSRREPGDHAGDPLQIPGVSTDGSHILIGRRRHRTLRPRQLPGAALRRHLRRRHPLPDQPGHLYMRVERRGHLRRLQGHDVTYVGTTADCVQGLLHLRGTAHQRRPRRERRSLHVVGRGRRRRQPAHPHLEGEQSRQPGRTGQQRHLHRRLRDLRQGRYEELRRRSPTPSSPTAS